MPGSFCRGFSNLVFPVVVLGGLGLALFSAGSTESNTVYGSSTDVSSTGWIGAALVCLAVAVFFGRGTLRSLRRALTGQGRILDALCLRQNLWSLLIAAGAIAAAGFCLFSAATESN